LPAWWIAYLTLLGRPDDRGTVEWYPLGQVLMWIAATATLVSLGSAMAVSTDYETYSNIIHSLLRSLIEALLSGDARLSIPKLELPTGLTVESIASIMARVIPFFMGFSFVPMITANLWLAGKAVALSGRFPRTWPSVPATRLPKKLIPVFAAALVLCLGPGFIGFGAIALVGALLAAFMLGGLATIHFVTQEKAWRTAALSTLYLLLPLTLRIAPILLVLLLSFIILLGIADTLFNLRHRGTPPRTPFTPNT
jgi:hypothetical protein